MPASHENCDAATASRVGCSSDPIDELVGHVTPPTRFGSGREAREPLAPASWKRAVVLPAGRQGAKDATGAEAVRRWPAKASLFALKKHDGRTEAALIAVAGMKRESI